MNYWVAPTVTQQAQNSAALVCGALQVGTQAPSQLFGIEGAFNAACERVREQDAQLKQAGTDMLVRLDRIAELERDLATSRAHAAQLSVHIQQWQAQCEVNTARIVELQAEIARTQAALASGKKAADVSRETFPARALRFSV